MALYEVISNNTFVLSKPSFFSSYIGTLSKDTIIDVKNISGGWAQFYFNDKDGYIRSYNIKKAQEIKGSVTINYVDDSTLQSISQSLTNNNLALGTYSYNAISISGYNLVSNSPQSVTLTKLSPNQTITFKYKKIVGSVTIKYIDNDTLAEIASASIFSNLNLISYSYDALSISGYTIMEPKIQSVTLTEVNPNQTVIFKYKKQISSDLYVIELSKFNIFNNNTEAVKTTKGINDALNYAKQQAFKKVQLPAGNYLIENDNFQSEAIFTDTLDSNKTWKTSLLGIIIPSDITVIFNDCIFTLQPNNKNRESLITFANSHNSKVIGGSIIGDRYNHIFEVIINNDENSLEFGTIDSSGNFISDTNYMVTKNFISTCDNGSPLPNNFAICPLQNSTFNTVDGGRRNVYCYDSLGNFLGKASTNNDSFLSDITLLPSTSKIKVDFKYEKNYNAKFYITTNLTYKTFEQSQGITIYPSDNIEINGLTITNHLTDGICTFAPPINHHINNLKILNCIIENNRRQGISLVGNTDGALIQNSKIGKTQGVDPQCGIDFEHYGYVKNIIVDSVEFYDNYKWDIINYNGWDIEVKDSKFNGGIASTYGYNMDIHNNKFVCRSKGSSTFSSATTKNDADNAYYKIYNNYIEGYTAAGGVYGSYLKLSYMDGNTFKNCLIDARGNFTNNIYYDCTIVARESSYLSGESLNNVIINGDNISLIEEKSTLINSTLVDCNLKGGIIIRDSNITCNTKSFVTNCERQYLIDNCNIITNYLSECPFITSQFTKAQFINCNLELSFNRFVYWNYGTLIINNCNILIKNIDSLTNTNFTRNTSNGTNSISSNNWIKNFSNPTITIPSGTNQYINSVFYPINNEVAI